ncbi:MAG: beta strand repeat-containing protein [Planctomycetota bacterium]
MAFDKAESVEFLQVGTVTVRTLNAADTLTVANDLLGDGVTAALSVSGTSGAVAITKALVRGSGLTIDTTSSDGNDTVTVTSANNSHTNTSLSINTGTGTDTIAVSGAVTMAWAISLSSPAIRLGANLSTNVAAAAGSLSLTGAVTLTATAMLTTDGSTSDGAIQITGTLNGGFGATFAAGTGNVSVSDAIGATAALASLAVSSAGNMTFSSTLRTTGDVTQTTGSGTTSFNGTSSPGIGGNLNIVTKSIDFNTAASTVVGTASLTALDGIAFNANAGLSVTGTIAFVANNDTSGTDGFSQASTATIQTSNTSSSALSLTVLGAGGAAIGALQTGAGGRATVTVGGAISDNNGSSVNIMAGQTALSAVSGIGSGDAIETAVGTLAALNTSTNAISIANGVGGLLTLGTVGILVGVRNNGTHITIVNGSPLTIADDVVAGGDIALTATDSSSPGDNLVVNSADTLGTGTVEITAGGAALLRAGDDLTLNSSATVTAVGSATFAGDYNSDAGETAMTTILLAGCVVVTATVGSPTIIVTAGAGNDTVTLSGTYTATGGAIQVSTGNGSDTVTLNTSNSGNCATMTVDGGLGNDQITMTNLPNAITSGQVVTLSGGGGTDTLTGQAGVNAFVVNGSDSGTLNHVTSGGSNITNPAIKFDTIENLVAGPLADSFLMETGGSLGGSIDGGAGVDLLSYVNRSDAVTVDLTLGTATPTPTSIAGGIAMEAANNSTIENLTGGSGADSLTGDIDDNAIIGNGGDDTINAKAGTDSVNGGAGSDRINIEGSEAEYDTMVGGTGIAGDASDYDSLINIGAATVTLNAFNVTFDSFANSIDLYDGNNQSLQGNGGSNTLQFGFTRVINVPGPGRTVSGGAGDDTMTTAYDNSVATTYDGSTHVTGDTVYIVMTPRQFDYLTDTQITDLNAYLAAPTGQTLSLLVDVPVGEIDLSVTMTNFESARVAVFDDGLILDITTCFSNIRAAAQIITGSDDPAVSDTIDGTALTDLIFGQRGNDTIRGLAGNDCVFGGAGADVLFGQDGDDLLAGGSGNDTLYGGVNNDRLLGASGDDSLFGEAGDDQLDGGADNDMADGGADNDLVVGNTGNDSLFGDIGFDILQGGEGGDYLSGGLHDDVLNGGLGDDTVLGGDGFDTIQVAGWEAVNDVILGGANTDTVATVGTTAVVLNNFNASASSIEVWSGGGYAIFGTTGNNVLDFSGLTFSAVPFVDGSSGDDRITGTGGPDELRGGDGNDTLIGLGGVDILRGYAGDDSLNGGSGVDYLFGGFGADTLTAGDGRDIYYFAYDDAQMDTVTDFELYSDTLSFRDYRPTYSWTYSNLSFATVVAGTRDVILPTVAQLGTNKRIRLLGWTTNVASTQVRFT